MMPTPDLQHLILVKPLRSPPTVAQFVEKLKVHNKEDPDAAKDVLGKWDWNHDGVNKNGDLIFNSNGKLGSTAWSATVSWQKLKDGQYSIIFNGINHIMTLAANKKTLILTFP